MGLHYLQRISDAQNHGALHIEPGIWLNVPATTVPPAPPSVVRLATVPHGASLLAQGAAFPQAKGPPKIKAVDTIPFTAGDPTKPDTNPAYLKGYDVPLPPGIPVGAIKNPNLVLTKAIKHRRSSAR